MTTKIPVELSSTPGIVDGSNATAITIDSSENVTVTGLTTTEGVVSTRTGDASQFVRRGGSITTGFGDSLYILHSTTGDMAEDFGVGMTFAVKDSGATQSLGDLGYTRRGADNTADFILQTYNGGTRAEKFRVLAGGGICFNGDKVAANALDDYEEGTWTPTIYGASTTGSTSGNIYGKYIKIGHLVYASFAAVNINVSNASGHLVIGNFPFSNSGVGDREAPGVMRLYGVDVGSMSSYSSPVPVLSNNTTYAFVTQTGDDAAWNVVQISNDTAQYIEGSITYIAT